MKVLLFLLFFLPWVMGQQRGEEEESCYTTEESPYHLLATKTSYFEVDNEDAEPIRVEGCTAKSFWLLMRHGSRYPGDDTIAAMLDAAPELQKTILQNHEEGRGTLCGSDLSSLRAWRLNLTEADGSKLSESGSREAQGLGARFRSRFPELLGVPYDPDKFQFRHTKKQRTKKTAESFAEAAFPGEEVHIDTPMDEETLLRFYEFCTKWEEEVDKSEETFEEQRLFWEESEEVAAVLDGVADRLGFNGTEDRDDGSKEETRLTRGHLEVMYDLCRFWRAFYPEHPSAWCVAFSKEDLKVLEYHQDLEYWYKNGYGKEINREMACPLLRDIRQKFSKNETLAHLGTFYFGHSETVLPFLTLLGLYRDGTPLKHDNFDQMRDRQYRTSLIAPFGANIAFILYECEEEPTQRLATWHQERPVKPGRCSKELCDLEEFIKAYESELDCDFDETCELEASKSGNRSPKSDDGGDGENGATAPAVTFSFHIVVGAVILIYCSFLVVD